MNNLEDFVIDTSSTAINDNQHNEGVSRNTGFVSFSHQGSDVPDIVSKLAFLHEIGHSLGSPVGFFLRIKSSVHIIYLKVITQYVSFYIHKCV